MQKSDIFCMLTVLFLTIQLANPGYAIDPKNIVGEWHLDGSCADSSGKGNEGNIAGGGADWVDGKFGEAIQLTGQGDCIELPADGVPDEYTVSLWIYQLSDEAPGDVATYGQTILSSSSTMSPDGYGFWLLTVGGEKIRFYSFETASAVANALLTKDVVISLEQWYHIAATAVKGGDSVIYVDGVEVARWKNKGLSVGSTKYFIGELRTGRKIPFNGIVDEVTIFDTVLSDADIAKLARGGIAVPASGKLSITWGYIRNQ